MNAGSRNVLVLSASQTLMLSAVVLSMTLAGILGAILAPSKGLATLPIAAMVVGTAVASLPASLLMRRMGRRAGFMIGAVLGVAGSAMAAAALAYHAFAWFVLGHLMIGAYQGFANYYRFAAAEAAGPARRAARSPGSFSAGCSPRSSDPRSPYGAVTGCRSMHSWARTSRRRASRSWRSRC